MTLRCVRSLVLVLAHGALAACAPESGSQVSPVEGEVELASVAHTSPTHREPVVSSPAPRHAVEAWALLARPLDDQASMEVNGMVSASGPLEGSLSLRFGLGEETNLERSPFGSGERPEVVDGIVAGRDCARWKRDACLSIGGVASEGVAFRATLAEARLPVARVEVVDARRDPLEGIAVPFEGRLVGVHVVLDDASFREPIVLVRHLGVEQALVGVVEPPFDDEPRTILLGAGAEAILEHARQAFERAGMSRGAHRSFERALRDELREHGRAARAPAGTWHAYYALTREESARLLPIGL